MFSFKFKKNTWFIVFVASLLGILFQNQATQLYGYLAYLYMGIATLGVLSVNLNGSYMELRRDKKSIPFLIFVNLINFLIIFAFKNHFSENIFTGLLMAVLVSNSLISLFITNLFNTSIYKTFVLTVFSNLFLNLITFYLIDAYVLSLGIDLFNIVSFFLQFILIPFILSYFISVFKFKERIYEYGNNISIILLALINFSLIGNFWPIIKANYNLVFYLVLVLTCISILNILMSFFIYKNNNDRISFISLFAFKNAFLLIFLFEKLMGSDVMLPIIAMVIVNIIMLLPSRYLKDF